MKYLMGLLVFVFVSCAGTFTASYNLTENWIDEKTLSYAISVKQEEKWIQYTGRPVFIELKGDTVLYYFHYKTQLYKTTENGTQFQPREEHRTTQWADRTEMVALKIISGYLVGVERNTSFNEINNFGETTETKESSIGGSKILLLGAAVLALVIFIVAI